jgi:hypothetical protein
VCVCVCVYAFDHWTDEVFAVYGSAKATNLNPKPQTPPLNPKPQTLNPDHRTRFAVYGSAKATDRNVTQVPNNLFIKSKIMYCSTSGQAQG